MKLMHICLSGDMISMNDLTRLFGYNYKSYNLYGELSVYLRNDNNHSYIFVIEEKYGFR